MKSYLVQPNETPLTFQVSGDGIWQAPAGSLTGRLVFSTDGDPDNSSLMFIFEESYPGLVYTDTGFESAVSKYLFETYGLQGLRYSEQGEQGSNYVDFDMYSEEMFSGLIALVEAGTLPDGTTFADQASW